MDEQLRQVKGVIIRTNCTQEEVVLREITDYQRAVGGFIDAVRLYDYNGEEVACAYVDDEGILKQKTLNPFASAISFLFGNTPYLVGDVVIVGKTDSEGHDTDVPEFLRLLVTNICAAKEEADV